MIYFQELNPASFRLNVHFFLDVIYPWHFDDHDEQLEDDVISEDDAYESDADCAVSEASSSDEYEDSESSGETQHRVLYLVFLLFYCIQAVDVALDSSGYDTGDSDDDGSDQSDNEDNPIDVFQQ